MDFHGFPHSYTDGVSSSLPSYLLCPLAPPKSAMEEWEGVVGIPAGGLMTLPIPSPPHSEPGGVIEVALISKMVTALLRGGTLSNNLLHLRTPENGIAIFSLANEGADSRDPE